MGKAAVIGCDAAGAGWAARFLLNGWNVAVHDPRPEAKDRLTATLANARRSLPGLYDRPLPPEGQLPFLASPNEAVEKAEWVQIGASGDAPDIHDVLARIARHTPTTATVASASRLAGAHANGGIVARAHDPVYLLPLVELAGDAASCYRAEIRAGDRITVSTQVLGGGGKRVHLFHFIRRGDGTLAATMETLLIHTDLTLRRARAPDPASERSFAAWVDAHAQLDRPKDAGRAVSRQTG